MSSTSPQRACQSSWTPPGWYRDPANDGQLRWWDGYAWTGYTHESAHAQKGRDQAASSQRQRDSKGYVVGSLAILTVGLALLVGGGVAEMPSLVWVGWLTVVPALGMAAVSASRVGSGWAPALSVLLFAFLGVLVLMSLLYLMASAFRYG